MERTNLKRWLITAAVFMIYIMNIPVMYAASVINTKMVLSEGLDSAVLGYSTSGMNAVKAVITFVSGYIITKIGARRTFVLGGILVAGISAVLLFAPLSVAMRIAVYSSYGAAVSLGALVTTPVIIRQTFGDDCSMPMAVTMSAGTIAGILVVPLAEAVTDSYGWRSGWAIGLVGGLIAFIIALFLPRNHDGEANGAKKQVSAEVVRMMRKRGNYYILTSSYAVKTAIYYMSLSYVLIYVMDCGIGSLQASRVLQTITIAGLASRLIEGMIGKTRISMKLQAFVVNLIMAAGCILLTLRITYPLAIVGAGMIGFGYGAGYVLTPMLNGTYFDSVVYPIITGENMTFSSILSSLGPLCAAGLVESRGYAAVFLIMGLACAAVALPQLFLKKPMST